MRQKQEITLLGLTVLAQLLIVISVPGIVAVDVIYFGTAVNETSATERVQETLILLSSLIYAWAAYKRPKNRGSLILIAGLFGCMFIREQDVVFDRIQHGAWVYPAWSLALFSMWLAARYKHTIKPTVLKFRKQAFFAYLSLGFFILIGFSRLFGTGALWDEVVPGFSDGRIKTAVQEGLELLGYALIFYSAVVYSVQKILLKNIKKRLKRESKARANG